MICPPAVSPALLALGAAVLFALGIHLARLGLRYTDTRTGTLVTIAGATAVYWLAAPWFLELGYWLVPATLLFAAIGLFRPVVSGNLAMAGTRFLGPTVSSTLASTAPLFGLAFGVLVLDESPGTTTLLGTGAIVAGIVLLSWRGPARGAWPAWAVLLPVGAAFLRVLAQLLAKMGMESLPSPYFVGLVGYTVSLLTALAVGAVGQGELVSRLRQRGLVWFLAAGAVNGLAVLALNHALACGELVMISPVVASSPLFTLLLGLALFGETRITGRVVLGVVLVVPGVALVAAR